ncbi:DNA cytosine methyltransferase [Streptomyces celluloflavus]|uniref:DNA cytosine methyltransferase n=1 Tax=Streptomyces celluloflavus TaxID=58344 RepID=UPI003693D371
MPPDVQRVRLAATSRSDPTAGWCSTATTPLRERRIMNDCEVVDLFAGAGGLDLAAYSLGVPAIGIEWDPDTCSTRRAAGLPTVEGDVRAFSPADFPSATALTSGPPRQAYSITSPQAGNRSLRDAVSLMRRMTAREDTTACLANLDDERTGLVLEPLRWALAAIDGGRPYEEVVLEQSPAVWPVWQAVGEALSAEGYSVACGVLRAEAFGVPQTRRCAVLIARRHGRAALPEATHRLYRKDASHASVDPALLSSVTMGEVLARPKPYVVVSNYGTAGDPRTHGRRTSAEPASTVTSKFSRNQVMTAEHTHLPRLSFSEAGLLQSFPADYPWRGKNIPQQISMSIPPRLATHVLGAALGRDHSPAHAHAGGVERV